MKDPRTIVRKALITEKGTALRELRNQYHFEVARDANKIEIRRAIESIFSVKVQTVRTMLAKDILAVETVAQFDLDVVAAAQPLIEYLDQPDLNLIRHTGLDTTKLEGDATMKVKLSFPMIKNLPRERVQVNIAAQLMNASLKEMRFTGKVFGPYRHVRKVTVFGSARTRPDEPIYRMARRFGSLQK